MRFYFFAMDDDPHLVGLLTQAAEELGHEVGTPADVVFMLAKESSVNKAVGAACFGKGFKCVLPIRLLERYSVGCAAGRLIRRFMKTGYVLDVIEAPKDANAAKAVIVALDLGDTLSLP
jgi:hypothetical protein